MYQIAESEKSFDQACNDLEMAIDRHGFGILNIHDMGATLRAKGISFSEECRIFEICNPQQAAKVLSIDIRLNMVLPCRISVYTKGGKTTLGTIKPAQLLNQLSQDKSLAGAAREVEEKILQMVTEAC